MGNRFALALAATLVACSGPASPDAATDAPADAVADALDVHDAATDTAGDAGTLFGPCNAPADCPGPNATCIRVSQGYPNGQCSRRCSTSAQCGPTGACLPFGTMNVCFQTCSVGAECRDGYNCFQYSGDATMHYCFPQCRTDSQCPGSHCDVYMGFCGMTDTTLADNGGMCMANADCRSGRCITEIDSMGNPTGWFDGSCYSLCTIPSDDQYAGPNLPQGGCPTGSVCERGRMGVAGGIGFCHEACTANTDCRAGYICVHPNVVGGTGQFTNGYCSAMNCHYMTQMCPSFATCVTTASDGGVPTNGLCVRNDGGAGDATSEAGGDAADVASDLGSSDASDVIDAAIDGG
jgi:hypothetical protein